MYAIKQQIEAGTHGSNLRKGEERRQTETLKSFPHYLESRDVTVIRERRNIEDRREGQFEG